MHRDISRFFGTFRFLHCDVTISRLLISRFFSAELGSPIPGHRDVDTSQAGHRDISRCIAMNVPGILWHAEQILKTCSDLLWQEYELQEQALQKSLKSFSLELFNMLI
eukprot:GHVU01016049.1.p1 GENE.GHVU01016049.1~~GHVU01016049.1.p1  ORF type:complete len:108 (-),score=1.62 GHVU01016049.1:425-748(-)